MGLQALPSILDITDPTSNLAAYEEYLGGRRHRACPLCPRRQPLHLGGGCRPSPGGRQLRLSQQRLLLEGSAVRARRLHGTSSSCGSSRDHERDAGTEASYGLRRLRPQEVSFASAEGLSCEPYTRAEAPRLSRRYVGGRQPAPPREALEARSGVSTFDITPHERAGHFLPRGA